VGGRARHARPRQEGERHAGDPRRHPSLPGYPARWGGCRIAVDIPEADEAARRPVIVASGRDENDGAAALAALSDESGVRMRRRPALRLLRRRYLGVKPVRVVKVCPW